MGYVYKMQGLEPEIASFSLMNLILQVSEGMISKLMAKGIVVNNFFLVLIQHFKFYFTYLKLFSFYPFYVNI